MINSYRYSASSDNPYPLGVNFVVSKSMNVGTPFGFTFSASGDRYYGVEGSTSVRRFNTASNFDITGATEQATGTTTGKTTMRGIRFNDDGTKVFWAYRQGTDSIRELSLSAPYVIDNFKVTLNTWTITNEAAITDFTFKTDGTKLFILGTGSDKLFQFTLSTPFSFGSVVYDAINKSFAGNNYGFYFKPDGTKFFIENNTNNTIEEYHLSTAWDISSMGSVQSTFSYAAQATNLTSFEFGEDGRKLFITGRVPADIYQYTVNPAYTL